MRPYDTVLSDDSQGEILKSYKILTNYGDGVGVISIIVSGVVAVAEETVLPSDVQIISPDETMPAISGSLP